MCPNIDVSSRVFCVQITVLGIICVCAYSVQMTVFDIYLHVYYAQIPMLGFMFLSVYTASIYRC
jgi:hypothetical protein